MSRWHTLADVGLVPLRDVPLFDTFIPSKMFELMAAGVPVVASVRGEAREILLAHRSPETPVVLASNLGRPAERVRHTTLAAVNADEIDMLTVVLVGSSETRRVGPWAYTPRGYSGKGEPA